LCSGAEKMLIYALSVQQPLTLATISLSRVGVVGSVFTAALLTQVCTVVLPPAGAAQNIGVVPCRGETCRKIAPMENNKNLLDPSYVICT
jgi:hypothetical protein